MWLFTKYGFYSAVCARRAGQPLDHDRVMVRARLREHLDALKGRFPDLLGDRPVVVAAGTDYACRIFVDKAVWARIVSDLADDVDYGNFKSAVARHQGTTEYEHALHGVWRVTYDVQSGKRHW